MRHVDIMRIIYTVCICTASWYAHADASKIIDAPVFGRIELDEVNNDTWQGATQAIACGPTYIHAGTAYADRNTLTIQAPLTLCEHTYTLTLERERDATSSLEAYTVYHGTVTSDNDESISLLGAPVHDVRVRINPKNSMFQVSGITRVCGLDMQVTGTTRTQDGASMGITVEAIDVARTWYPFAHAHLPAKIQETGIEDISVGFKAGIPGVEQVDNITGADADSVADMHETLFGALMISGTTSILHTSVEVSAELGLSGGEPGIALVAHLPEGWHIADSFPHMRDSYLGTTIGQIQFHNARCVITSYDTYTIQDEMYERGLTITSGVSWDGNTDDPLLRHITPLCPQTEHAHPYVFMKGAWNADEPQDVYIKAGVNSDTIGFHLGPAHFYHLGLGIELTGEPSLGLFGGCNMTPGADEPPLNWYLAVAGTPTDIALSGSMRGTWNNPFGARNIAIRNLALKGAQSYDAIAQAAASSGIAALIPSQAGISGEGDIYCPDGTSLTCDIKANIGKRITTFALLAYLRNNIDFHRLARCMLYQAGLPHRSIHVPDCHIEELSLKLVPLGTYIGQVRVSQGIGASCYVRILGQRAYIDIGTSISEMGLHLYGKLPHIDIGPVHITGANGQDAPIIDSTLSLRKQQITAHGRIAIGDIFETEHDVYIGRHGMSCEFNHTFGPVDLQIWCHTQHVKDKPDDVELTIRFTRHAIDTIHTHIRDMMDQLRQHTEYATRSEDVIDISRSLFHVEDVYFHGTAHELVHGTMPQVVVTVRCAGHTHTLNLNFDFRHPHQSIKQMAHDLCHTAIKYTADYA